MTRQPNVLLIMTDNQQAATLGCHGNAEIHTPHLDALAGQAAVFDSAWCPNAFCSPCRASLLTGLMPSQHGVHSWIDDRREIPAGWHALDGLPTLPGLLRGAGYATALIGKYHLGDPHTPMPGFDHWVALEDGHVRSFDRNRIVENGETRLHEGPSVDVFTDRAVAFLEAQAGSGRPFFLFLPYPAPYGHWPATRDAAPNRHSARYADCPMETIPRMGLSREAVAGYDFQKAGSGGGLDYSMLMRAPNDLGTLRSYYAQISMIDDGVGALLAALDRLGLADDTLVAYTADHGLSLGHHGFWGHGSATFPSNMHRAAHSVPLILRHPGHGARRIARPVSNMDLFATVLDAAGLDLPDGRPLASRSLMPLLAGQEPVWPDDGVFAEQEETRVIRTPRWAFFQRFGDAPGHPLGDALFDLQADPDETRNLADDPGHAATVADLRARIGAFFAARVRPEADLWAGGRPIQNSQRMAFWRDAWGPGWAPVMGYGA